VTSGFTSVVIGFCAGGPKDGSGAGKRDFNDHFGTFFKFAGNVDGTAVEGDEFLAGGEAQPRAGDIGGFIAFDAVEAGEDSVDVFAGDAVAGVGDFDIDISFVDVGFDEYGAGFGGVLDSIGEDIVDDDGEFFPVGVEVGHFGMVVTLQSDIFLRWRWL